MAAVLRNARIAVRFDRIPTSSRLPTSTSPSDNSFNLSFSSTFPSLKLATTSTYRFRVSPAAIMSDTAAGSYAAALADVAWSNDTLDAISSDVEKIAKVFSNQQVFDFFANPTIALVEKREVLDELANSYTLQPHTVNLLNILLDSNRIEIIKEIMEEFEDVYNKLTDTELAVVTSVVPLEMQHLAQIARQVQRLSGAKNVRIKTTIDKSLVAGITVRYGNAGSKFIDLSVKKQLEEITSQLDMGDPY